MKVWLPASENDFVQAILSSETLWHATDPMWDVTSRQVGDRLDYSAWTGVSFLSPEDMVVTFRTGTRLSEAQAILAERRQCLPIGCYPLGDADPTLAAAIGFALPHADEGRYGSWREWILGMTVALGDGTLSKSGSKVVKSVAGYDAHKLFVGARGAFGVIVDVTLRTSALAKLRPHGESVATGMERPWIQRVSFTDFEAARADSHVVGTDPATATIWARSDESLRRYRDDWVVRGGPGADCLEWTPDETPLIRRAKALLDPAGRLNPGALGIC